MNLQDVDIPLTVSFIKDIVTIIALGIGGYVAIVGLNTWKQQLRGSADFELARTMLKEAYRLRNAVSRVRNPFITSGEMGAALKEAGIEIETHDPQFQAESNRAVYAMRWKAIDDALGNLEVSAVEAEAIWGNEIRNLMKDIRKSVSSLSTAIDLVLRHQYNPNRGILDPATQKSFEEIMYRMSDDSLKDDFASELEDRIKALGDFVKPRFPN